MIVLTDRPEKERLLWGRVCQDENCTVVALEQALLHAPDKALIILDVEIENPVKVHLIKVALKHHTATSETPVFYLARKPDSLDLVRARSIGVTTCLSVDIASEGVRNALSMINTIQREQEKARYVLRDVKNNVSIASTVFAGLFASAGKQQVISATAIESGGDIILATLKQASIRLWLDIVYKHDDLTLQHCLLVAGLVAAFSVKLGLSLKNQRLLAQAALIHDIGKARIPSKILNKGGPLTKSEIAIVKTHPDAGFEMLKGQRNFDPLLLDVVRHHHEFLDGSGYPDRLREQQIPYFVRLVTVCDIYAALIERRPYRAPMSPSQAFSILEDMGPKLDNDVVKTFRELIFAR